MIRKTAPEEKKPETEKKVPLVKEREEEEELPSTTPTPPLDSKSGGAKEPKYNVKYRHTADLEDSAVYQVPFLLTYLLSDIQLFTSFANLVVELYKIIYHFC